jgi:phage gp29-like protein
MAKKRNSARRKKLANDLVTVTSAGMDGVKITTEAFTPVVGAKKPTPARVRNQAITQAGSIIQTRREKKITPEQKFDTSLQPTNEPTAATDPMSLGAMPEKTQTRVSASRVQQYLLAKFNPIRGLTPKLLNQYLEQWDLGFLRQPALIWNKIRERDDQIQTVVVGRELKPTDMPWEIVQIDESDEALAHKEALEEFYNNISVTHALEQNKKGGVQLLIQQMMRAVGDKYSVHEIIWKPGDILTAELKFIPVWFFENRTGLLRFLPYELALQGIPLDPGGWLVHVGEGLFQATAIAYIYKQMALKDWVNYCEKFGLPFLHGKTSAAQNSTEWQQFAEALEQFSSDGSILTSLSATLEPIKVGESGSMPQPPLCDRMDRAIARIWKGGDLSTMSRGGSEHGSGGKGGSSGSNAQQENEDNLAKADGERISETCNAYIDAWVIKYKFGNVRPLAKFVLSPPEGVDVTREISIDQFFIDNGVPVSQQDLCERYNRSLPDVSDPDVTLVVPRQLNPPQVGFGNVAAGFRQYQVDSVSIVARAQAKALMPVKERLATLLKIDDPDERVTALKSLQSDLPRLLKKSLANAELHKAFENVIGTAIAIGAVQGSKQTKTKIHHVGTNGHDVTHKHLLRFQA